MLTAVSNRAPFRLPRDEVELALYDAFRDALTVAVLGCRDRFQDVGGARAGAEAVRSRIAGQFGHLVDVETVLAASVDDLARIVDPAQKARRRPPVVTLNAGSVGQQPLFVLSGGGGTAYAFSFLVRHLGTDRPIYGIEPEGLHQMGRPDRRVGPAAVHARARLRLVQPHGPYDLLGHCYGALVAVEVARLLHAAGEEIGSLTLLDPATGAPAAAHCATRHRAGPLPAREGPHRSQNASSQGRGGGCTPGR